MGEVSQDDAEVLSRAVVVWTGWEASSWPDCNDERVADEFGAEQAATLIPGVEQLYHDFYESDAAMIAPSVTEAGDLAAQRFRGLHPEISEEAVLALRWCYTYDYK